MIADMSGPTNPLSNSDDSTALPTGSLGNIDGARAAAVDQPAPFATRDQELLDLVTRGIIPASEGQDFSNFVTQEGVVADRVSEFLESVILPGDLAPAVETAFFADREYQGAIARLVQELPAHASSVNTDLYLDLVNLKLFLAATYQEDEAQLACIKEIVDDPRHSAFDDATRGRSLSVLLSILVESEDLSFESVSELYDFLSGSSTLDAVLQPYDKLKVYLASSFELAERDIRDDFDKLDAQGRAGLLSHIPEIFNYSEIDLTISRDRAILEHMLEWLKDDDVRVILAGRDPAQHVQCQLDSYEELHSDAEWYQALYRKCDELPKP